MRVVVKQVQKGGRTDISSVSSWLSSMLLVSWNHQIQRKHPKFVNDWTFILFRRSNVPDGPFFWWRLSHIWTWGNCLVHSTTASYHHPQQFLRTGLLTPNALCSVLLRMWSVVWCTTLFFSGDRVCRARPGGPPWPSHLCFPKNDKGASFVSWCEKLFSGQYHLSIIWVLVEYFRVPDTKNKTKLA